MGFESLSCLIDAINVLDDGSTLPRADRLASVSSSSSLNSQQLEYQNDSVVDYLFSNTSQLMSGRPKIPRKRITTDQTCTLQSLFNSGVHFPSREMRDRLAKQLGLTSRTIQVWFQNRRQAARNRARSVERPPSTQKMCIRWMKPVVFYGGGNQSGIRSAESMTAHQREIVNQMRKRRSSCDANCASEFEPVKFHHSHSDA